MPRKSVAPKSFKAEDNLGLAFNVCKKFHPVGDIEDSEMLSDAYLALVRAEQHFNPNKGFRFSTYAWACIYKEILKGLRKRKTKEIDDNEVVHKIIDYRPHRNRSKIDKEHDKMLVKRLFNIRMRNDSRRVGRKMMKEYYLEGKTYKEIGEKYGCTKQRVQQKINEVFDYIRSREKFKEIESLTYYNE